MNNTGWAIHCHHDVLIERCYNYKERAEYIKVNKPQNEQEIRLKLFKILPDKAVKEIPKAWRDAEKASEDADKAWQDAETAWQDAYKAWSADGKKAFHDKWCGCKEWDGKKICFKENSSAEADEH